MEKPQAGSAAQECTAPSTTFVRADATTFKELVQRLTGPNERDGAHRPVVAPAPPSSPTKLSGLKRLHERRQRSRPKLTILKPGSTSKPPTPAVLSPSVTGASASPSADFAGLNICEHKGVDGADELDEEEEERAIKERRFYLHPSPRSRSRNPEPELLPLFPLTSPRSSWQPQFKTSCSYDMGDPITNIEHHSREPHPIVQQVQTSNSASSSGSFTPTSVQHHCFFSAREGYAGKPSSDLPSPL